MSSKRHIRRKSCESKIRYSTRAEADGKARASSRVTGQPFNAYPCKFCGGYHIGHIPYRIGQKIRARRERNPA